MSGSLDEAGKLAVRAALLARVRSDYEATLQQIESESAAAEVDPDSSYSIDDLSQADASGDLTGLFEAAAARQEATLTAIESLDMAPTDVVRPGAIVSFDGATYVVGVVADAFDCDGVTYEGISSDSPVGAAIMGLRAGDTFSANGHDHTLDGVC